MTDNEIIARWVGLVEDDDYNQNPRDCLMKHGSEIIQFHVGLNPGAEPWQPDTDIARWHGEDGLLERLVDTELLPKFIDKFLDMDPMAVGVRTVREGVFLGLWAGPSQLTAALVATIKEVSDGSV